MLTEDQEVCVSNTPPPPETSKASRILFVRSIPRDIDQRTIEELFSKQPGFVTLRKLPHFAFVEFTDVEASTQALTLLQNYHFRQYDRPLIIDYDKDSRADDPSSRKRKINEFSERDKSFNTSDRETKRRDESRSRERERERFYRDGREYRYNPVDFAFHRGMSPYPPFGPHPMTNYVHPGVTSPTMTRNHHPTYPDCATLYVTSLPKDVTERELNILFRFSPGFTRVRLVVREGKMPICFADFVDGPSASYALQTLQGFPIDLRDPTIGLHIEFDNNHRQYKKIVN